jgi:hypothetical protein
MDRYCLTTQERLFSSLMPNCRNQFLWMCLAALLLVLVSMGRIHNHDGYADHDDGHEDDHAQAALVHFETVGHHDDHHAAAEHAAGSTDLLPDIAISAIGKVSMDYDMLLCLVMCVLCALSARPAAWQSAALRQHTHYHPPPNLRPPPRAPPLLSV